jgi:hypothetical protein
VARNRFDSISGGLIDTVIAGVGNNVSTAISNIGRGDQASFSLNSVTGGLVENATGYALNQGQNYLISQLTDSLTPSENNSVLNSVAAQVTAAGVNAAFDFVSQTFINPFVSGSGNNVTTAGLVAQGARSSISIPDSVVSRLEDADYGGIAYTVQDIVFTLTPAQPGAQAQQPPQTSPTMGWDQGFSADSAGTIPAVDALKGVTALNGPAKGVNVGGRNYGAIYGNGNQLGASTTGFKPLLKPLF